MEDHIWVGDINEEFTKPMISALQVLASSNVKW